ncbi:DUF6266 family protein [Pedobacter gandavensis]|uniref:Uncharacterized protein n=1 Tax=Pedobacter gandavensis TaxID=2679963 RepID=A0ABR6EWZ6_9SPHI|nr:DUF6266 family protein [Pedobacter gandavensis]MBB2149754.1 hypothetical protein [Pedobacter gandavensis]
MAICKVGPFGHPSGKIGNMVFYMLNGQAVCRSKGKPGKPSLKQKANQEAMKLTMELLKPMKDFINVSFKQESAGSIKNPHNLATSYNKKQALTGEYPNIKVDYNEVILSRGTLEMAEDLKVSKGVEGLDLSWDSGIKENGAADDILMVLVSHPTKKRASTFLNAAKRADGSCFIPLDREWMMTEQMEVYVCLKSSNEKLISDSAYVGNLNGAPDSPLEKAEKMKFFAIKARFDQVAADYEKKKMDYAEGVIGTKAFRYLEKEYQVLRDKLKHLPGKPS